MPQQESRLIMKNPLSHENYQIKESECFWQGTKIAGCDLNSFKAFNSVWAKDLHNLYRNGTRVNNVQIEKLKILNLLFCHDTENVFYIGGIAKSIEDPKSFKVLDDGCYQYKNNYKLAGYAKDIVNVYFHDFHNGSPKILSHVDLESFEVVMLGYAKDKNKVWSLGRTIKNADPITFTPISPIYSKDSKNTLFLQTVIHHNQ